MIIKETNNDDDHKGIVLTDITLLNQYKVQKVLTKYLWRTRVVFSEIIEISLYFGISVFSMDIHLS